VSARQSAALEISRALRHTLTHTHTHTRSHTCSHTHTRSRACTHTTHNRVCIAPMRLTDTRLRKRACGTVAFLCVALLRWCGCAAMRTEAEATSPPPGGC
jgi:hypothetical protein